MAVTLLGSACVKPVRINELLAVQAPLSMDELVNRINAHSEINTFSAQAENVIVRNYFTGVDTKAEQFPAAAGLIRFQRPDNTFMRVTFYGAKVADMASDGQHFGLAIFRPSDKRRFIYGSNLNDIDRMNAEQIQGKKDAQLKEAGGLVNMRPQHITDSFLIKPISPGTRNDVFREEVRQTESDTRPNKKNRFVEKTYYVVYVLERGETGQAKLRRKFWFDRTMPDTPLVRQQTFENGEGRIASDVTYSDWFTLPDTSRKFPSVVTIDRRSDGYRLKIELEKDSVEINAALPEKLFKLENTENLEELNLDAPRKASIVPNRKQ
ncbi:MAG: hypothetical protein WBV94_07710 [Blastocatellia bacterium]